MSWLTDLFSKSEREPEPEEEKTDPDIQISEESMLPDYSSREDTGLTRAVAHARAHSKERAELEATAKDVCKEASRTSRTLRSMSAFVIPKAAQTDPGE